MRVKQVHGSRWIRARAPLLDGEQCPPEADAIISNDPLLVPIVSTADCAPVLVYCRASNSCAAIHAGWRGIALDIITKTIRGLEVEYGASPPHMLAAVGPCASGRNYEVGADVVAAFVAIGLQKAIKPSPSNGKHFADCAQAARILLERAGVPSGAIDANPPCTIEDSRFASHRREPLNKVRMLSGICVAP